MIMNNKMKGRRVYNRRSAPGTIDISLEPGPWFNCPVRVVNRQINFFNYLVFNFLSPTIW